MNQKALRHLEHRKVLRAKAAIMRFWGVPNNGVSNKDVARMCLEKACWEGSTSNKQARKIIVRYWEAFVAQASEISEAAKAEQAAKSRLPKTLRSPNRKPRYRREQIAQATGTKTPDAIFFDSREWFELRYKALKQHGAACQCCGETAKSSGEPLHVDHIKPRHTHPELEWDLHNLQILCRACNLGKGAWDKTDWRISTEATTDLMHAALDAEFKGIVH